MQHFLKAPLRAAGAGVIAAELLDELLVTVNGLAAALYGRFRRETLATLATSLETRWGLRFGCGGTRGTSSGSCGSFAALGSEHL